MLEKEIELTLALQRLLEMHLPFEQQDLHPVYFKGREILAKSYSYTLGCLTKRIHKIKPKQLLYQPISVSLKQSHDTLRWFHGIIDQVTIETYDQDHHWLSCHIVPPIALLQYDRQYQIFYDKNVIDIFRDLCQQHHISSIDYSRLHKDHANKAHCIQYGENSDIFLRRILADEGIFYYFTQDKKDSTIHLIDDALYLPFYKKPIYFIPQTQTEGILNQWVPEIKRSVTRCSSRDFNYRSADTDLQNQVTSAHHQNTHHFHYPGNFQTPKQGDKRNRDWLKQMAWQRHCITAHGLVGHLQAGMQFELISPQEARFNGRYWIFEMILEVSDNSFLQSSNSKPFYRNKLKCVPCNYPFQAPFLSKPIVEGHQSAIVSCDADSLIQTDDYGSIKIKFPWNDDEENKSSWTRVSQPFAGQDYGYQFIPYRNEQVMLSFRDGDPEQAIVLGSYYHAENRSPYSKKEQSGIKQYSRKDPEQRQANELHFDDRPGKELCRLQGEHDMIWNIDEDSQEQISGSKKEIIGNDYTIHIVQGKVNIHSQKLHLSLGKQSLLMTNEGIEFQGNVQLRTKGAGTERGVARLGDQQICPQVTGSLAHKGGIISTSSSTILNNGIGIARQGDTVTCLGTNTTASIKEGIKSITINGLALSCINHTTDHGGTIVQGSQTLTVKDRE